MLLKVGADKAEVVWKSKAKGEMPNQTTDLSSIMPTPVIDGDHIYGVCSYGQLRCIEANTGKRVWETMKATRGKLTPPKVAESDEPGTGERWSNAFIVPTRRPLLPVQRAGRPHHREADRRRGTRRSSRAHLIDPTNKDGRGRSVVWVHPAFADKCVFVRNDKEIACFDLAK